MKKVSAVVLISIIAFFITTANSASIGTEFEYRSDIYGWPNKFLTIIYEKAKVSDVQIDSTHLFMDFGLWLAIVGTIRLSLWSMRVKRKKYVPTPKTDKAVLQETPVK